MPCPAFILLCLMLFDLCRSDQCGVCGVRSAVREPGLAAGVCGVPLGPHFFQDASELNHT